MVHAFEPEQRYFTVLRRLAEFNPDYQVVANHVACGARTSNFAIAGVSHTEKSQCDAVCRDPSVVPSAVAEALRFEPNRAILRHD